MLGMNSQNSSKPPSSDGPEVSKPVSKGSKGKQKEKKRGAQKGHKSQVRKLFEPKDVDKFIPHEPEACTCGCQDLEESGEESLRHQTVDIPPIKPTVIEHVQHIRKCKKCGELVYAQLPNDIKRNIFGPGVLATVGVLTGMLNTSKRKALAVINEVFHVPMSLGGLNNCEARIASALEKPYNDTLILKMRIRVRDGTLQWKTFQRRMPKLQKRVESLLEDGAQFDGKLGGKCRDILKHKDYLWSFVDDIDVEPTNNFAEQNVRQGVLWRKTSFGTQSDRGARYVERILTTCATCHLQDRSIIEYLRLACYNHRKGIPAPELVVNF